MAFSSEDELVEKIYTELAIELSHEPLYNDEVVKIKVWDALREVRRRRCYEFSSLTASEILADLERHYSIIKDAARIYYNRMGSEGESVHYENTVHRSFANADELFIGVVPYIGVV